MSSERFSRGQRKQLQRQLRSAHPGLEVVHHNASGIDVGSREYHVAVAPDRAAESVQSFGFPTMDLHRMSARWRECGLKTVVLQSTGVYWIPVYDVLERAGFDEWLVNARETRNLPGRKSDVQESLWAAEVARLWAVAEIVPAAGRDPGHPNLPAGTGRIRATGGCMRAAQA